MSGGYDAVRGSVAGLVIPRDIVRVGGPDATTYLQGQLSQDVEALAPGQSALSFLLQPQGKVEALVRVARTGDDELLVDTDGGWGQAVVDRLVRFRLRVKVDIDLTGWACVALRGPGASAVDLAGIAVTAVLASPWPAFPGIDLIGPDVALPSGIAAITPADFDAARIEAGVPLMGAEVDDSVIPQELGIVDQAVSFTKGCYTGQELVARIDSRGHVNRQLRGVVLAAGGSLPPPGATIRVAGDDRERGTVTSVARRPGDRPPVALAFVRREIEPPAEVQIVWPEGATTGRVEALPLSR